MHEGKCKFSHLSLCACVLYMYVQMFPFSRWWNRDKNYASNMYVYVQQRMLKRISEAFRRKKAPRRIDKFVHLYLYLRADIADVHCKFVINCNFFENLVLEASRGTHTVCVCILICLFDEIYFELS